MTTESVNNIISHHKLYRSEKLADFHFIFDSPPKEKRIPAHKIMLITKSKYFDNLLTKHSHIASMTIADVPLPAFSEFLQFFYVTNVKLTHKNISQVVKLVKRYTVDTLEICEDFLRTNVTDDCALWFYGIAVKYKLSPKLIEQLEEIICNDPINVFKPRATIDIDRAVVDRILRSNIWKCSEVTILRCAICWATAAIEAKGKDAMPINLRLELGDLFYHIGFPLMTPKELVDVHESHPQLLTREEYVDVSNYITDNSRPLNIAKRFRTAARVRIFDVDTFIRHPKCKTNATGKDNYVNEAESQYIDETLLYFRIVKLQCYNRIAIRKLTIGIKKQPWGDRIHVSLRNMQNSEIVAEEAIMPVTNKSEDCFILNLTKPIELSATPNTLYCLKVKHKRLYCKERKINGNATPFDELGFEFLRKQSVSCVKNIQFQCWNEGAINIKKQSPK